MGRRSKIDMSPHKAEIEHLMLEAQWSSLAVSKYLNLKYTEDIPASSLRTWRTRKLAAMERRGALPEQWQKPAEDDKSSKARIRRLMFSDDEIPDILQKRLALAKLQEARIGIDSENEFNIGKLFAQQGREIDLLNKIYDSIREDLQNYGVMPAPEGKAAVQVTAYGGNAAAAQIGGKGDDSEMVEATPLASAIEGVPAEVLQQAGRTLVLLRSDAGTTDTEGHDE